MIHLDTSILVDALTGPRRSTGALRELIEQGERVAISALVLYQWLRGPRSETEVADQQGLFPSEQVAPFGAREAAVAAHLYRAVPRARHREFDLAVAACALGQGALLWTLNSGDFRDIPGLALYRPRAR